MPDCTRTRIPSTGRPCTSCNTTTPEIRLSRSSAYRSEQRRSGGARAGAPQDVIGVIGSRVAEHLEVANAEDRHLDAVVQSHVRYVSHDLLSAQRALYSSAVTWSSQVTTWPFSSASWMATWAMKRSGVAPCQCSSPGS